MVHNASFNDIKAQVYTYLRGSEASRKKVADEVTKKIHNFTVELINKAKDDALFTISFTENDFSPRLDLAFKKEIIECLINSSGYKVLESNTDYNEFSIQVCHLVISKQ